MWFGTMSTSTPMPVEGAAAAERVETRLAAARRIHPRVFDDVVAVRRAGTGLQNGGEVEPVGTEIAQVSRQRCRVVQRELGRQLQPVGRPGAAVTGSAAPWPAR